MDLLHNLILGFHVALSPVNIFFCLLGALIGTLVGVLPGIGPVATLAILLPTTFYLPPIAALIMLAGIYYGAQYTTATTSRFAFTRSALTPRCDSHPTDCRDRQQIRVHVIRSTPRCDSHPTDCHDCQGNHVHVIRPTLRRDSVPTDHHDHQRIRAPRDPLDSPPRYPPDSPPRYLSD